MNPKNSIEELIYLFSKLPGLGPRSARRIVLYLLDDKQHRIELLANSLQNTASSIVECSHCFNLSTQNPCHICNNEKRDNATIAIVESVADLWALDRSESFNGLFHILGSNLNANNGYKPENLRLGHLLERAKKHNVKEIIIATNSTLDGQTTAFYITEFFKNSDIKITRLASGMPMGGELDYLDSGTLTAALNLRQVF